MLWVNLGESSKLPENGEEGNEVTRQCPGNAPCFDFDTQAPEPSLLCDSDWMGVKMSPSAEMGRPSPMGEGNPGENALEQG